MLYLIEQGSWMDLLLSGPVHNEAEGLRGHDCETTAMGLQRLPIFPFQPPVQKNRGQYYLELILSKGGTDAAPRAATKG